jgi:hypothetical protein
MSNAAIACSKHDSMGDDLQNLGKPKLLVDETLFARDFDPNAFVANLGFVGDRIVGVLVQALSRLEVKDGSVERADNDPGLNRAVGEQPEFVRAVVLDGVGRFSIPKHANLVTAVGGIFELEPESPFTL